MADSPQAAVPFRPARTIEQLGDDFYDPVTPAVFPQTILRWRNDRAATEIGLGGIDDGEWVDRFARFRPFDGSLPRPLALRYHGHQFRIYNPDLGDGRGFLYAQMLDGHDRLMDLGTKGSGTTPWSRFGDGRLTLKGAVRELLATEMLEALGVQTSRTLSIVETGEALHRGDEPSPTRSAVLVRMSHGHVRIGSFQRLAWARDADGLRALTRYTLAHLFGVEGDDPVTLMTLAVTRTARLAASYMAAGFVHGVLNSDNINVTGESFDYGPWRFAKTWDPTFTAAYFDQSGLYAFGQQPEAIAWDVAQLGLSLSAIAPAEALQEALNGFGQAYRAALIDRLLWRLGVAPRDNASDLAIAAAVENALIQSGIGVDAFFFDWRGGRDRLGDYDAPVFGALRSLLTGREAPAALGHHYWSDAVPCGLPIEEVEALWAPIAEGDDWDPLRRKIAAIRRMGDAMRDLKDASAA